MKHRRRGLLVAVLSVGLVAGLVGFAPSAQAAATDFVPVTPKRLLDTRATGGGVTHIDPAATTNPTGNLGKAAAGQTTKIKVADIVLSADPAVSVPTDAAAVALTVTGVDSAASDNYLTVWDCSDAIPGMDGVEPDVPLASNLNLATGDIRANAVVSKVGTDDDDNRVCIYSRRATHLVVDITGYFPTGTGLSLQATPVRKLDTRPESRVGFDGSKPPANQVITVHLGAADQSAIVNVTGVDGVGGFITVWNCADLKPADAANAYPEPDPPTASSLNIEPGIIAANLSVVLLNGTGDACFFTSASTHLVVDLIGTLPNGGNYTGQALPVRVLESRTTDLNVVPPINQTGTTGKLAAGSKVRLDLNGAGSPVVPDTANAVILNVTGTQSSDGYVTVYPCADLTTPVPTASNLNLKAGQSRAAGVITKIDPSGGVCFFSQNTTHLIADLMGFFDPTA